ncbi:GNAT family N-acetyltransferase [Gynuella sunshinyii]|uniref:Acetyltransferase, including N-acetylase of ribosomal protein n=1 Tax=Gynuella sunshinyii YC6258 TaxID=1445510 RepID=A0A0C5V2R1_9GAMM|nr:GNAT family protein [Gynuella sunshinyii]AJQ93755.1 acetyltransferase, including N-acetylase of ribosomal protein [Gynuella sunshinyii YC6258]
MNIVLANHADLPPFLEYLERQLQDNGTQQTPLFQPLSRSQNTLPPETREKFQKGIDAEYESADWRKLWLAKSIAGQIIGHVDLRHYGDELCRHRVLLGMGVDHKNRQQGVGTQLVHMALNFCHDNQWIDWLDLQVLSDNLPAKQLYLRCGFVIIGEIADYYRIDGESVSETLMTQATDIKRLVLTTGK